MVFPPELASYLTEHGYLAVSGLIFLQELGLPNPVPNEAILLFAGYLSSVKILNFYFILLVGILSDFIGTSILYGVFYFFGDRILKHAPNWLPVGKMELIKQRVVKKGIWGVFLGRLLPYLRGYVSVAAGLLKIPPRIFLSSVLLSAIIWSGGYILAGRLLGKEWGKLFSYFSLPQFLAVIVFIIILIFFVIPFVRRWFKK